MASSTSHDTHLDVVAGAIAGASATMLTLMATLGSTSAQIKGNQTLKILFEAEILILELTLIAGVLGLIIGKLSRKRLFAHLSGALLIIGTLLLWLSATLLVG